MIDKQLIEVQQPENNDKLLYVEYGAGKAGLSSFIALKLGELYDAEQNGNDKSNKRFLVIDRETYRGKKDFHVRNSGFETERVRIDIANFDLIKYL